MLSITPERTPEIKQITGHWTLAILIIFALPHAHHRPAVGLNEIVTGDCRSFGDTQATPSHDPEPESLFFSLGCVKQRCNLIVGQPDSF
jgi:hypothetical protein